MVNKDILGAAAAHLQNCAIRLEAEVTRTALAGCYPNGAEMYATTMLAAQIELGKANEDALEAWFEVAESPGAPVELLRALADWQRALTKYEKLARTDNSSGGK